MNLAETQTTVKRLIVIFVGLTLIYYAGRFIIVQGVSIYQAINPPKLPPAASKFGKLPQLKMQQVQIDGNPKYTLDTQNGKLPVFPDRMPVYPIIRPQPVLLSEQKVKQLAADLNFTGESSKLTNSVFRWVDGTTERTFQADAVTKNFQLDTPSSRISNIVATSPAIAENDATASVEGFLKSKTQLATQDSTNLKYETVPTQVNLGQIRESKNAVSNAKLIKVNAYIEIPGKKSITSRTNDTKYRILGPNPKDALINFTVSNSNNASFKYPIINYTYWEVDYNGASDYYISPVQDVWNAVQAGNGITTYMRTQSGDYYVPIERLALSKIEIRDVYLAYYMQKEHYVGSDQTEYMQPIYVFHGQLTSSQANGSDIGEIFIYFPAVRGDYTQQ